MIHHYLTKYTNEKGELIAESWFQLNLLGKCYTFSDRKKVIKTSSKGDVIAPKLAAVIKKEQFLTSELGPTKLNSVMTALDELCNDQGISLTVLADVIPYRQCLNALPDPLPVIRAESIIP
jgi:hypothetical protein